MLQKSLTTTEDGNGDSGTQLPVSAVPTDPGSATAKVTEYENNGQGKEFYTIQTASEKTFYLIVYHQADGKIEKNAVGSPTETK